MLGRAQDIERHLMGAAREALQAALHGDLEAVEAQAERLIALGDEFGSPLYGRVAANVIGFWPLLWLGRTEQASRVAGGRYPTGTASVYLIDPGLRALILAHQGRLDEARAELHKDLERLEISDQAPTRALANLLETAVLVGDREAAALLAPPLEGIPATTIPLGAVTRHVGGAARLLGDWAAARTHYDRALEWATKLRFRPEIALTRLEIAELLLDEAVTPTLSQREREQERREALVHVDFAVEEFRAMKMQPALERALRHKGLLKA